ncbi:hypothetical protein QJS04_geneDACA008688 [Acorus gramineus]|uniref:PPIase cyclophilin-type domain-containing protein n=1 Tax=Acorus gramineus TaxID=55184 RepID=A0AAV9AE12_ACOGR|nr:hypothetical protein QJS04_geneDACA008688 [Acorus gramineus]
MGRRQTDSGGGAKWSLPVLLLLAFVSCSVVYLCLSVTFGPRRVSSISTSVDSSTADSVGGGDAQGAAAGEDDECCRGTEHLEFWGSAVKWGTDFKFNTSRECCRACKAMCSGGDGPCLCDSWVFCGDRERCGEKFGECWLKKQKDALFPTLQESGDKVIWTSGLIFGKGELLPDCAPLSVAYIVELLGSRHCAGCKFYRAEGRGNSWDSEGNHIVDAPLGPPFALIQGTLEAEGVTFKKIPTEACPPIQRGSVAWIGSGPEFFISLANHDEWRRAYTVFGSVLPEDMEIAEKIARLPTEPEVWNNVNVSVLEKPVRLRLRRITTTQGDLNLNTVA